jgi:hypothetical protein
VRGLQGLVKVMSLLVVCALFFKWLRWGRRAMRVVSNVTHYADVSNII